MGYWLDFVDMSWRFISLCLWSVHDFAYDFSVSRVVLWRRIYFLLCIFLTAVLYTNYNHVTVIWWSGDPDQSVSTIRTDHSLKLILSAFPKTVQKKENFVEIHPQLFDLFIVLQIDRQTHAHTSHKPSHNLYGEGLISYKTVGCTVVHCAANFFIAKSIPVSAIIRVSHVPYHCLGI